MRVIFVTALLTVGLWTSVFDRTLKIAGAAERSQAKSAPAQQGVVVAASAASTTAQRLKMLIAQDAGLTFPVVSPNQTPEAGHIQFVLCTKATRSEMQHLLSG